MGEKTQVIVVGGGASGLAAAIAAAENGAAVTLLEQNENPGRKICVTGNGRCNLTNRDMRPDIFRGQHPEFVEEILAQFTLEDTLAFFEKLGVAFTERNGWLYPRSNQAKCIPELLILKARAFASRKELETEIEKRVTGLPVKVMLVLSPASAAAIIIIAISPSISAIMNML
mgnify:CR=1 FL=1